jgi:DNA-binding PadR family transcriptional regulator
MKITIPTQLVLGVFLDEVGSDVFGLEIMKRTELTSGSCYTILAKLENIGWIESRLEDAAVAARERRPRRRYYRLTGVGEASAPQYCSQGAGGLLERIRNAREQHVPGLST